MHESGSEELLARGRRSAPASQRPVFVMPEQLGSPASDASCSPRALAAPVSACLLSNWPRGTWPDGC